MKIIDYISTSITVKQTEEISGQDGQAAGRGFAEDPQQDRVRAVEDKTGNRREGRGGEDEEEQEQER